LGFDVRRSPFDDVRVRRAFVLAANRETLVDAVRGEYASPATGGLIPPGIPAHSPGIGLPYDPEQARQLLAEAGYPGGRGFPDVDTLIMDSFIPDIQHLQAQWGENLGVEIHWEAVDKETTPGPIFVLGWVADYPDPDSFLRGCPGLYIAQWQNDTYYKLVEKARQVIDQEERMRLYRQADRILMEEAAITPLFYTRTNLLVKPWVTRFPTSPMSWSFWKDVIIEPH
jgi:oligopeptide transport system substrate-binding protein